MKIFLKILLVLLIVLTVLVALNWSKLQRLQSANTVFDTNKIVSNFSNMRSAFLHHQLKPSPQPIPFEKELQPLPEVVTVAGKELPLSDLLEQLDTTALVIVKDDKIVFEKYYQGTNANDLRISWSVAKSFMSGLYGPVLETGLIKSLDDRVEQYVPNLTGTAYEGATIRNVLNMASGVTFNEDYMDFNSDINQMGRVIALGRSMDNYARGLNERDTEAGKRWQYVSIDTHVAAMVLRAATGKSLHQLFNESYSANLGFEAAPYYLTDGEDVAFALGGLNVTTRDYARFGQLFLHCGQVNGKQVIPCDWVKASTQHTAPSMSERGIGYGYQWWVPMPQEGPNSGDFFAVGIYGQYVYVNPARNIVIAKNAADREFSSPMESYGHSMNANIDIFRSLADYFSE